MSCRLKRRALLWACPRLPTCCECRCLLGRGPAAHLLAGWTVVTIQDWGAIREIIGAAGVVASLLYLAAQIRQNSKVASVATTQGILGTSAQMNAQLAGDVSPALFKLRDEAPLSSDEEARVRSALLAVFAAHWQVYYQHSQGMVDAAIFEAYERRTRHILEVEFNREWWKSNSFRFSSDHESYVNQLASLEQAVPRG